LLDLCLTSDPESSSRIKWGSERIVL